MAEVPQRVQALLAFLTPRKREQYLVRYVLREHGKGRSLDEVFHDPFVRNRSTLEEQARLLERPEVVAELGEQDVTDLRARLARSM